MRLIDEVVHCLQTKQYDKAKELTLNRCKTKPIKLAHRVGKIVGALCDPDGLRRDPDLAVKFLSLFEE